jgi:hypothetical protein
MNYSGNNSKGNPILSHIEIGAFYYNILISNFDSITPTVISKKIIQSILLKYHWKCASDFCNNYNQLEECETNETQVISSEKENIIQSFHYKEENNISHIIDNSNNCIYSLSSQLIGRGQPGFAAFYR